MHSSVSPVAAIAATLAAGRPLQLLRPAAASILASMPALMPRARPRCLSLPLCRQSHRRSLSGFSKDNASPPHSSAAIDIDALRASMAARPAKAIYDVLSPVPSHLLNISLSDYMPPECGAVRFSAPSCASSASDPFALPPIPSPLPHGHHLVHFPLQKPPSLLLPDGTDPDQSPGSPFDRRMWAGGSVRFDRSDRSDDTDDTNRLVLDGRRAACVERLGNIKATGSPGAEKIFVDVWRRYGPVDPALPSSEAEAAIEAAPAVEERRTLVFMRDASPHASPARTPPPRVVKLPFEPDYAFTLTPSATLLFHFSALTYNAHAIHLDPQYCRQVESHRNLLFHGPLSLVLMLSILRSQVADPAAIKSIEYRNLAPLYADEPLRVCIRRNLNSAATATALSTPEAKWDVWVEGPEGGLAVRGAAITA